MPRVIIFHGSHFMDFYQRQSEKTKTKILYVLDLIKQVDRVPEKFLKSIAGTKGLFEIHVEYRSDIHRIFCCFDKGMLVVLLNGYTQKSQKTPKEELAKAEKLMKEYFGPKN